MPRKRRQPKLRIDALDPALVDVILTGDSERDPFLCFDVSAAQIDAAWETFGDALAAEARRRGIEVTR
jgi:hypothetical protein